MKTPGTEGHADLLCEVSAQPFEEFSHNINSKSSTSPQVIAVKIDLGNFIHKFNLLVPNMKTQWLCLAAMEGA